MDSSFRARRLKMLAIAGIVVPALMALAGLGLMFLAGQGLAPLAAWPSRQSLALGVAVSAASMGLIYALYKSSPTFERALKESGVRIGEEAVRSAGYAVMLVVVSASGVGEEILFRGGVQAWTGVVPAALLFGFSHGGWRREMWAYALAASVSGGFFGLAYHLTGDIWVPIIAHVSHNILATFLLGREDSAAEANLPDLPDLLAPPEPLDEVTHHDDLAEPLPPAVDGPATGPDDGNPPDRDPERPD